MKKPRIWTMEMAQQMRRDYLTNPALRVKDVAAKYNLSYGTTLNALKAAGTPLRAQGGSSQRRDARDMDDLTVDLILSATTDNSEMGQTDLQRINEALMRAVGDELRRARERRGWGRSAMVNRLPSGIDDRTLLAYEPAPRGALFYSP